MKNNIRKDDLILVASFIVTCLTGLMIGLAYTNMLSQWMVGVTLGIIGMIATYFFKKSGKLSEYEYYLKLIEKMELPGKWDEIVDEIIERLLEETEASGAVKAKLRKRIEEIEATEGEKPEKKGEKKQVRSRKGLKAWEHILRVIGQALVTAGMFSLLRYVIPHPLIAITAAITIGIFLWLKGNRIIQEVEELTDRQAEGS